MRKDYSISMIRFIGVFMIIFCHIFEWVGYSMEYGRKIGIMGNFLAAGVQVFLILSGFLYGSKELFVTETRIDFIVRNFKKILVDYYIYLMILIPICYIMVPDSISYQVVLGLFSTSTNHLLAHFWFIPYILFCYLITPLLYDLKTSATSDKNEGRGYKGKEYILLVAFLLILFEFVDYCFGSYFIATWLNCYIVGFFLPSILKGISENRKCCIAFIQVIVSIVMIYVWYRARYICANQSDYIINYSRSLIAMGIFCGTWLIGRILVRLEWIVRILKFNDRFSYDIYLCHYIFV